jgi:hypothetical protein
MINDKKQFKFYRSYWEVANEIESDSDKLDYLLAILDRHFLCKETELKGVAKFAYISQKHSIEAQCAGYEQKMQSLVNETNEDKTNKGGAQGGAQGAAKGGAKQTYKHINLKTNNLKTYKGKLLSQLSAEDVETPDYLEIAKSFQNLFKKNIQDNGGTIKVINNAKGTWYDDIRLLIESDGAAVDSIRKVFKFLQEDEFWKKNILSTKKLREQFNKLIIQANAKGKTNGKVRRQISVEDFNESIERHFR